VRVPERCHHLDPRTGTEPIRIPHFQNDPDSGLLILGNLGDEQVGAVAVAKQAGSMVGLEFQREAKPLKELRRLSPVMGCQEYRLDALGGHLTSTPSPWRLSLDVPRVIVQVGAERIGDERRERQL
jgi:hypothetical protein